VIAGVLAIALFSGITYAIDSDILIISPLNDSRTSENSILSGWTDYAGNFTHYRVELSDSASFSDLRIERETANTYLNLGLLEAGIWYIRVLVYNGTTQIGISDTSMFETYIIPEFRITTDLREYEEAGIVIVNISAPVSSQVDLLIDGPDRITYHPTSLQQNAFRTVLSPGHYEIYGNLTYYDYSTTFRDSLDLQSYSAVQETQQTTNDNNTEKENNYTRLFLANITTKDEEGELLPYVLFMYSSLDNKSSAYQNRTEVTDNLGNRLLELPPDDYLVSFEKEGYLPETKLIELNYQNITLELTMKKDTDYGDKSVTEKKKEKSISIVILEPQNDTQTQDNTILVKYTVNETDNLKCQLLINNPNNEGWEIEKESIAPETGENTFQIESIKQGPYKIKIKCIDDESLSFFSNEVYFSIFQTKADTSLIDDIINSISESLQTIQMIEGEQKKFIDSLGIQSRMESAQTEVENLNKEYNSLLQKGASESELEVIKGKIIDANEKLLDELPKEIIIQNADNLAIYLPVSGFEELFENYLQEKNQDTGSRIIKMHKNIQEEFIVKKRINELTIETLAGGEEQITTVSESVVHIESEEADTNVPDNYTVVIFISDSSLENSLKFVNSVKKISDNFYEVSVDESGKVDYYFTDTVDLKNVRDIKTLIISPISESADSVTGFSVLNVESIINSHSWWYVLLIVLTISGIMGIMYMYSPSRIGQKNVSLLTKDINTALTLIDRGDFNSLYTLYPQIMTRHDRLDEMEKTELKEIMVYLINELDAHNMTTMLVQVETKLNRLLDEEGLDTHLYKIFLDSCDKAIANYNTLSEDIKPQFFKEIQQLYTKVMEMNNR